MPVATRRVDPALPRDPRRPALGAVDLSIKYSADDDALASLIYF
jgi:hypothetical protein